jgi:hypothetical protein
MAARISTSRAAILGPLRMDCKRTFQRPQFGRIRTNLKFPIMNQCFAQVTLRNEFFRESRLPLYPNEWRKSARRADREHGFSGSQASEP